ncbi:protein SPO16 homolog [Tursiops truncatus]|uniref:protein SPO16 homolog n=1 Tax=Tursiops truncatus TaxID=9739 RepID=UPI003CCF1059
MQFKGQPYSQIRKEVQGLHLECFRESGARRAVVHGVCGCAEALRADGAEAAERREHAWASGSARGASRERLWKCGSSEAVLDAVLIRCVCSLGDEAAENVVLRIFLSWFFSSVVFPHTCRDQIFTSGLWRSYEVATALENRSHKVRYSDSVENGSIIFSLSGVAFLLMDAKKCFMSAEETFLAKIEKFINIHRNSFLVLSAALHGPEEWKLMFRIQQRFLGSNLRILPVHNTINAINLMCTIAKITSKPHIDSICYRMITTKAYIIEQSPVWKTLQKIKLSSDTFNPN